MAAIRFLKTLVGLGLLLGVFAWMGSCSQDQSLYLKIDNLAKAGKYDQAAKLIESKRKDYGERDAVLFNMDRGIMYHYAGKYKNSNAAFELAERRIDDLFTQSISKAAGSFLLNDNTIPFKGEDFEGVVINIYRSLNYLQMGDVEGALVEARKVDHKLGLINRQYGPKDKNVYGEDAFVRMLMGIFYEMGGSQDELNDAYISNKKAYAVYQKAFGKNYRVQVPNMLGANLLTTANFMGRQEVEASQRLFPGLPVTPLEEKRRDGQIYILHFAGHSPIKQDYHFRAMMPDRKVIKIAFPRYVRVPYKINASRVQVSGRTTRLEVVEPLGAIAVASLGNRLGRIKAKAIARALTKYLANRALQKRAEKSSAGAGLLASLAGAVFTEVSEQADIRSWRTLPDMILMGRVTVPPGEHDVRVEFLQGNAVRRTRSFKKFKVNAGQTRFILVHSQD